MNTPRSKTITAAELMAQLQSDPTWMAAHRARELKRQETEARLAADEAPLVSALASVGVRVATVWDLVNASSTPQPAIPVLLAGLQGNYDDRTLEGVVRALGQADASGSTSRALVEFAVGRSRSGGLSDNLAWVIAFSLSRSGTSADRKLALDVLSRGRSIELQTSIADLLR